MASEPRLIRRDKATRDERAQGSFYIGTVTGVRSDNRVVVRIPALQVTVGPVMPINATTSNKMSKGDQVLCAFTDYTNSTLAVFGTLNIKTDQYAPFESGITRFASIGERDETIPTPEEGRVVYITDTDELQIYNGEAWITVIDTGSSENISVDTLVANSASIGTLTVTGESTLNVLGASNLSASTTIGTITPAELSHLDGVTSGIQAQINAKAPSASPTFTGTASFQGISATGATSLNTVTSSGSASFPSLSVSGSTSLSSSTSIGSVTSAEIGRLSGVTSAIQTQINAKIGTGNVLGTSNQITATVASGNVTLSLPSTINLPGSITTPNTSASSFGSANGSNYWRPLDAFNNMYFRVGTGSMYMDSGTYYFRNASSANMAVLTNSHFDVGGTGLTDAGAVSCTNWFRSTGNTGWYSQTHGGGIWMQDSTWVRVYNGKNFYCPAELRANSFSGDGGAVYGSYGSISIRGSKNGYAGFDNVDTSSTLMMTNTILGHFRNNGAWSYYFNNGSLFMLGDSNYVISYVNNNGGLPWCYGPYIQGYNGWAYSNTRTGQWRMGFRDAFNYSDGLMYLWVDGRMVIGRTPDDAHAFNAHLMVDGSAAKSSGGTTWGTYSDVRSKEQIEDYGFGLEEISKLRPVSFTYNGKGSTTEGVHSVGLIAQEVEVVFPECVRDVETFIDEEPIDDFKILEFNDIQFAMINAIKEIKERLERLENG